MISYFVLPPCSERSSNPRTRAHPTHSLPRPRPPRPACSTALAHTDMHFSSSEKQVRAGRLQSSAIRKAHANRQPACSADPTLWTPHGRPCLSPGVVRRAARRSEMQVMFAVRMRLGQSSSVGASTDLYRRSARAHELSRRAQRTASTLIPRAPSALGVVAPAAGATRAVSSAWHEDAAQRSKQKSKMRLPLFSPASTPLER